MQTGCLVTLQLAWDPTFLPLRLQFLIKITNRTSWFLTADNTLIFFWKITWHSKGKGSFCRPFPDDFRLFCGDLGNEVTDEVLARAFGKYPSFGRSKVIRDKRTNKTKGYGFVSFKDPNDYVRAMREMNGKNTIHFWNTYFILLTLSPPMTTKMLYANNFDPDKMPSNLASHPDLSCLTLRQHFHQFWATFDYFENWSRREI